MRDPTVGQAELGTCPFCERAGVQLVDSHIIPRWAFRRVRGTGAKGDPILVSTEASVQTAKQMSEPMLCAPCDQALGVYDRCGANLAYRDGRAKVLDRCTAHAVPGESWQLGNFSESIDVDGLSRFGAAVFWRGHHARCTPRCNIGDSHARALRLFLRNQKPFPRTLTLTLTVYVGSGSGRNLAADSLWEPTSETEEGLRTSDFMACGLEFRLHSGASREEGILEICLQNSMSRAFVIAPTDRSQYLRRVAAVPVRGKGARRIAGLT